MPIYRYRCEQCSDITEVWAKMSDPPPESCPTCGGGPMVKAVARTAFHLKGGGWYAQGYGSSGGTGSGGGSSIGDSGSDSASGSSDSSDSSDSSGSDSSGDSSSDSGGGGDSAGSTASAT